MISRDENDLPMTDSTGVAVTRQVKKLAQDPTYKSVDFFDKCAIEPNFKVDKEQITIQAPKAPPPTVKADDLNIPEFLLKDLTSDEIVNIANQLIRFAYDPLKVTHHLKDLDEVLGKQMQASPNLPSQQNSLPTYLIAGRGNFIPGAPPPNYQPLKKGRMLDAILLEREGLRDVNKHGFIVKFIGYVSSMIADRIVSSGQLFNENKQVNRVLLHGSYTHRLLLEAFAKAVEKGDIDLNIKSEKKLDFVHLLHILVSVKSKNGLSLWEMGLDSVEDSERSSNAPLDSKQFSFSCRSPFVFNSLLLCFGKELGLPNLQTYMLDSHYKAAYEMVLRSKEKMAKADKLPDYSEIDISDERIYERCMEYFSIMAESYGEVGGNTPFTIDELSMLSDERYISSMWGPSVRMKISAPQNPGVYTGWMEFFQHKSGVKEPLANQTKKHERSESDEDEERRAKRKQ
ncbi:hypothetical protein [Legionella sp. WA2022007384]